MTLFAELARTSRTVAGTRSRNAKVEAIAELLRQVDPDEQAIVADHLAGVLPQGRTGVGWRSLQKVEAEPAAEATLSIAEVDEQISAIASTHGSGSASRRSESLTDLWSRLTTDERAFLTGLLLGDARQGAGDGIMLKAVAAAAEVKETEVRRAVMLAGRTGPVAAAALQGGAETLAQVRLEVGRPLRPMLAGSSPEVESALDDDASWSAEVKLDGIRIQAHKDGDEVRLFTRSLDDITDRLPEVVEVVRSLPAHQLVLDGEAIALKPDGSPQPFQVTGARTASSADPESLRERVPVTPLFFDLLHLDGEDLVDTPMAERRDRLEAIVPAVNVVTVQRGVSQEQARAFFDDWVARGHEGVVLKRLDAPYAAGRRGATWIKVKPRHTLDLVVLAVEEGSGRRKGYLSNIHLGARNADGNGFTMLGKTFKGMTDEMLAWQTQRFTELMTDRDDWLVRVRPEQVVEIAFDGLQRSTRYPGGVALRFARVLRYRDDKSASEADTLDDVLRLAQWGSDSQADHEEQG
ncbi:ATP-dependent DNA ligase [Yimella sp. cx-573]|nr:ATP-dependent DNA ligase [Yimella sp. cx-573]